MEMHQVRYFLAVADELNFTRAAERCHVAQPSLTRAIKLLEEELGGPLFHRERANTHLSELGQMVKPYLEQVYGQAQEAKRQALYGFRVITSGGWVWATSESSFRCAALGCRARCSGVRSCPGDRRVWGSRCSRQARRARARGARPAAARVCRRAGRRAR